MCYPNCWIPFLLCIKQLKLRTITLLKQTSVTCFLTQISLSLRRLYRNHSTDLKLKSMERVLCSCIVRLTGANINKQTTSLKFVLISAYQSPSILPLKLWWLAQIRLQRSLVERTHFRRSVTSPKTWSSLM